MGENKEAGQTWLRLGEAAEYVGVHPATLRRWCDEGRVPCIRTPGGRRRFAAEALDAFLQASAPQPSTAIEPMPSHPVATTGEGRPSFHDETWYAQTSNPQRAVMRKHGRKLMATLMQYAARDDVAEAYLQEGSNLAAEYAQLLIAAGLSVDDMLRGFLVVKRSITESIHEAGSLNGPPDTATWRLYKRSNDFLDHVLLTIIGTYHQTFCE